jgi:catechol 2,3-dioxygenase-like lactoylglutathione lyase family enzyme
VFARINHMAIISHNYPMMGKFYESVFGLKTSGKSKSYASVVYGDGYVGLNIIPRRDGYVGGLDHFGIEVDDCQVVLDRMKRKHPGANIVERPSERPFAAFSGHDPDGNVFDMAEKKNDKRSDIYADQAGEGWHQDRYINNFTLRTPNAERCAEFYRDVFELTPSNKTSELPGYHLTDGRVTLSILPWSIEVFKGMSIKRPGPDHIGFHVENLASFQEHVKKIAGLNPYLAPVPLGGSKESDVRANLVKRSSSGKYQMTDPDGVWIDITDE